MQAPRTFLRQHTLLAQQYKLTINRPPPSTTSHKPKYISQTRSSEQHAAAALWRSRHPSTSRNKSTMYGRAPTKGPPFTDSSRYYTMSVILGTVALSYGSVPLYKMVIAGSSSLIRYQSKEHDVDLPANRLGRSAHQSLDTFVG